MNISLSRPCTKQARVHSGAAACWYWCRTLAVVFRKGGTRLALVSMIATMGTPLDVSLQNLRLEMSFPADDATAQWFRQAAAARPE